MGSLNQHHWGKKLSNSIWGKDGAPHGEVSNAEIKDYCLPLAAKQQLEDALRNDCPDSHWEQLNLVLSGHCKSSSCTDRDCAIATALG